MAYKLDENSVKDAQKILKHHIGQIQEKDVFIRPLFYFLFMSLLVNFQLPTLFDFYFFTQLEFFF